MDGAGLVALRTAVAWTTRLSNKGSSNFAMSQRDSDLTLAKSLHGAPAGYFVVMPTPNDEDALGFTKIISTLSQSWKPLLTATMLGAVLAGALSYAMPKTYRARMILAPVSDDTLSGSVLNSQLGGIAALAGGLGLGAAGQQRAESFATLTSDGFARDFIVQENLMPILFAKLWDPKAGGWRPGKPPMLEAGVRKFTHEVLFATENHNTGLVTVMVEWYSPDLAATWANRMVDMVNDRLRAEATRAAERSIHYLNDQLAKNNVLELHQAISRLIEQQVNRAMVANVRRDYAFRVVDPAVPPDLRFRPQRFVMAIVGAATGFTLGLIYVWAYRARRRKLRPPA
jgi:hypothetical protein